MQSTFRTKSNKAPVCFGDGNDKVGLDVDGYAQDGAGVSSTFRKQLHGFTSSGAINEGNNVLELHVAKSGTNNGKNLQETGERGTKSRVKGGKEVSTTQVARQ